VIEDAVKPCLFLSGGADSVLLLHRILQIRPMDCFCFSHRMTKEQWGVIENLIKGYDLEVYTLPPARSYVIEGLSVVDEYQLGEMNFPVIRDLVEADNCLFDNPQYLERFPFDYETVFMGTRKDDVLPAIGKNPFKSAVTEGSPKFVLPLWDWTKEEVFAEIERLNLPIAREWYEGGDERYDTGNLIACHKCLKGDTFCPKEGKSIKGIEWDAKANTQMFRRRFLWD